jgi:hypothetical protein
MKCVEKYCDICGAREKEYFSRIENRIRHFSVRKFCFKWERLDICDGCYEEMRNLVRKKKEEFRMGE